MKNLLFLAVVAALLWYGYSEQPGGIEVESLDEESGRAFGEIVPQASSPAATPFICDGRTHCSQMRSCAEATFFIRNCPDTQMDGDGDGIPCERQWCGG